MLSLSLEECDAEIKVYKITSIYGRNKTEDFIKRLYEENKIISFNREGLLWLQAIGISLPNGLYNVNHLCDREYRFSVGVFIIKKINSLHRTTIVQGLR